MSVTALLNYVRPSPQSGEDIDPVDMEIHDGRAAELPGWETCGFQLMSHPAEVSDWNDEGQLHAHYAQMADLARSLTGCDHALVGGHIARNPEQAAIHEDLAPIQFVHSDFADSYGDRIREYYASDSPEAVVGLERAGLQASDVATARRLVVLQFWRNVGPAAMDLPIAFCDARSVPRSDVLSIPVQDYAGDGFDFDTLAILPGEHRWYTFEDMAGDEVVAFRTYDSAMVATGEAYWTPHSAFLDPRPGLPDRSSIELRATCLWL